MQSKKQRSGLNKLAKVLLVATSAAPVLLTFAFERWWSGHMIPWGAAALVITILLVAVCALLLKAIPRHLESFPIQVRSLRTADTEIVGFVLAYVLPLVNMESDKINPAVLAFVIFLFFFVVLTSQSYHFNPLLSFFGYHFYEVTGDDEVTYVLITRRSLRNTKTIREVFQLTEYMLLDTGVS